MAKVRREWNGGEELSDSLHFACSLAHSAAVPCVSIGEEKGRMTAPQTVNSAINCERAVWFDFDQSARASGEGGGKQVVFVLTESYDQRRGGGGICG